MRGDIQLYNGDCLKVMKEIPDESVDVILTDPPYKYLKNQKLERDFDEDIFFNQAKRVLKKGGFIIMFGRGTSFYRWNTILDELGLTFKEEIVWDKINTSSPLNPLGRQHETCSVYCKGKGVQVNRVKIPYEEKREFNNKAITRDVNRIVSYIKNNDFEALKKICLGNNLEFDRGRKSKYRVSAQLGFNSADRALSCISSMKVGCNECDVMHIRRDTKPIHPTQKPVRLLERLLNLVCDCGITVLDPFMGSGSTGIACLNTNRRFIGIEIDDEYFQGAQKRILEASKKAIGIFDREIK